MARRIDSAAGARSTASRDELERAEVDQDETARKPAKKKKSAKKKRKPADLWRFDGAFGLSRKLSPRFPIEDEPELASIANRSKDAAKKDARADEDDDSLDDKGSLIDADDTGADDADDDGADEAYDEDESEDGEDGEFDEQLRRRGLPSIDYWRESTRPLSSLLFVTPILFLYEVGILVQGMAAARNGADVWLRGLLDWLGFGQYFLLPALTCAVLLGWHHATQQPWRVASSVFSRMMVESMALAVVLLLGAQIQSIVFATLPKAAGEIPLASTGMRSLANAIGYLGAGIYEELMFRLLFLPVVFAVSRALGGSTQFSLWTAIILSSGLFAAAHYQLDLRIGNWHLVVASGYPFDWCSFIFRFWAGVFFALIFVHRGFGIAVGSHALYDLFAVIY